MDVSGKTPAAVPAGIDADAAAGPARRTGADWSPERGDGKRLAQVIGANLRFLRKRMFPGWGGQRKFAEFLELSPNDVCVYEHGRIAPSELRQATIAERLGLTPEQLCAPLPGVEVPGAAAGRTAEPAEERARRERLEEAELAIARLEGRIEALQEQNRLLSERAEQLQEANYALRYLLYGDDTPEARARRERVLEGLKPSIAELARRPEVF